MMEQPKIYNNLQELIDWLKYDLDEQREEIAKDRGIYLYDVKDEELVLHIGNKNSDSDAIDLLNQQYTTYNIYFDFYMILSKLDNNKNILRKDNKDYMVCKYRINARHCIFNSNFETFQVIFEKEINFFNSKFNKCNKNKIDNKFLYCKFKNSISFDKCLFNTNLFFCECIFFDKVKFCNSELNETIKFHGGGFYEAEYKDKKSNNKINIYFNNSFIKGKLVMNGNKIENTICINLDNISFENSKSLLSIKDMTNTIESVSLKDIYMNGRINFYNIKIKNINLRGTNIIGDFSDINCEYDNLSNWQTARILKHEEYKKSNSIKALEYHAEETKLYKEYLSEEIKKKFNIKKFGDILSISLSSLYSNNGLNWIKSFLCTILFSTFFFTLSYNFYIPIFIYIFTYYAYTFFYNKDIEKYIYISMVSYIIISLLYINTDIIGYTKELFSFITPTNFSQILYDKGDLNYIYNSKNILEIIFKGIFYFLGKIAFWYGSVQTVQSFRKFSKKE